MSSKKSVILVLLTIWIICLIGLIAPIFTGTRISVPDVVWEEVYHSPSEDKILLIGYSRASLFNLELKELGRYQAQDSPSYDRVRLFDIPPVWSPNEEYVILQESNEVMYLDADDMTVKYEISKYDDLKLVYEEYTMNQYFVDDLNRLHYVANDSLIYYDPINEVRTLYANLTFNNLNIFFVRFHSSGDYISIYNRLNDSAGELLLYNILNDTFISIADSPIGRYEFAPTKPYIAIENTDDDNENTIQVYNFETDVYFPKFKSDPFIFNRNLSWSDDSEQIMILEPQSENVPFNKAYPDRITTYNVKSGEKDLDKVFKFGYVYESSPRAYIWLPNKEKIVILDSRAYVADSLIIQDLGENTLLLFQIAEMLFYIFGISSALLIVAFFMYRHDGLYNYYRKNYFRSESEKSIPLDYFRKVFDDGLILLNLYFIVASILNFSLYTAQEQEQIPIPYFKLLIFSLLTYFDVIIILIIATLFMRLKLDQSDDPNIQKSLRYPIIYSITAITIKMVQGYSIGSPPTFLVGLILILTPVLIFSYIQILRMVFTHLNRNVDRFQGPYTIVFPLIITILYGISLVVSII